MLGVVAVVLAALILGPLLRPGFVLVYDMVFVPRQPFSLQLLGISPLLPRSVPIDLAVAVASRALTGQVVQKLLLAGIFGGAFWGAARLVPVRGIAPRIAAGVLYTWNPLTYERLLLGQWVLLAGYAVLPWVASAALSFRRGVPGSTGRLMLALAVASLTGPYGGLLAAGEAAALALAPPWAGRAPARRAAVLVGAALVVNVPWLVPAIFPHDVTNPAQLGMTVFRARADSPLGTAGSLVSLGGLWRTDVAPPGRTTLAWVPAFLLIAGVVAGGWRVLGRRWPRGAVVGLLGLAVLGFAVAVAPGVAGLRPIALWLDRVLPGGGLLRDSQKFVIPLALAESVGFGVGLDLLLEGAGRSRPIGRALALLVPLLPLALAPTLAWGASGKLSTAGYPPSWARAEQVMRADSAPGAVLILPWHADLPFRWNHDQTVHQPAVEYFSRPVVASSALEVGSATLPDEDPWAALARPVALSGEPMATGLPGLGVRYVLLFKEAEWRTFTSQVAGLTAVLETPDLILFRGAAPGPAPTFPTPNGAFVIAIDAIVVIFVVAAGIGAARRRSHVRTAS